MNKWLGYLIILLFVIVSSEAFSYLMLSLDVGAIQNRLYSPPSATAEEFARYLDQRDPDLGWPSKDWLASNTDSDGARLSPANEKLYNQPACISVYGDSFIYSLEVGHSQAWTNVLADILGCPVKNYGVPGYGVDQAVIRFENNANDFADFTILGFHIDDLSRNVNQWRYLAGGPNKFAFKPAFTLDDDGKLRLLPIAVNSYEDFLQTAEAPGKLLKVEMHLTDKPSLRAKTSVHFPYSWTVMRFAAKIFRQMHWQKMSFSIPWREWNYPRWYDDSNGPDIRAIDLNFRLIEYFSDVCRNRNRRCAILAIPNVDSIRAHQLDGATLMGRIVSTFRQHGDVWDATGYFAEKTRDKGPCYYIGPKRNCRDPLNNHSGHFNKEGYGLLAQFVAGKFQTNSKP